jgi:hypothetical protein
MKRWAALAAMALVTGCGGSDEPPRKVRPVALARPPLADALGKQAAQARLAGGELGPILERLKTQPSLHFDAITREGVTLRDVDVRRRGDRVAGEATASEAELAQYAPGGVELRVVDGGPGITLKGTTKVLGVNVDVTVHVVAEDGAVVAEPENLPVGRTVLFSDPRVHVDGVTARRLPGGNVRVRAVGTLR